MIDTFQSNNYAQDFSDVKSTIGEISGGNQPIEHGIAEEKLTCENTQPFIPNDKVNKEEEVCEENFCSSNFGQTEDNGSSQQGDCLFCGKTRRHLTADGELMRCQPSDPSRKINAGAISEQKLRDHISAELITCGLREICNGGHGLARNINRVNSLPNSPVESLLHVANSTNMHSSFPDIRKLHAHHLSPKLSDSSDSLSCCSLHVEDSFENENNSSFDSNGKKKRPSLSIDLSKCRKHGGLMRTHLGPEYQEERQRSRSARIPYRSPVQQVLKTENRSVSCSQLDKNGNNSPTSTSPPYVRPRIQSLEELPPCTAEVILRKKKSIIRKTRMKHTASLSFVDNVFNNVFDKGKRHSYGGYDDITFLQLPHLLQRSHSTESQLDSCNSSIQSLNSSSSFTENELGSTFSVMSELSIPGAFDQSLGRSRSVPGYLGVAGSPQTSPIPEERASVSDMEWPSKSDVNSDDDDDDVDGEMDVPEAFAEALWDHVTMDPEELSFQAGDIITVLTMTSVEWWFGQVGDRIGWFPAPFVRVRVSQTLAADETKLGPPVRTRKGTNEGFLSDTVVRSRVVLEILNTERDYVKHLEDVVEGYLKQARKRTDMFSEDQITKIFSNIEQLYEFHQEILRQLEECFVEEDPCASEIGAVFLNNPLVVREVNRFLWPFFSSVARYSKKASTFTRSTATNHPHAMAELKTLCESNKYKQFFEACRLLQDMISISLDGFLLTPVQKICKYPLQLA
ncbi:Rho guanine nucleotide exchange factor 4, partial [Desmophyllum pertusum]